MRTLTESEVGTSHQRLAAFAADLEVPKLYLRPYETLDRIDFDPADGTATVTLNTSKVIEQTTQTKETRFGIRVIVYRHLNAEHAPYEDWWELESDNTFWDITDHIIIHKHFEEAGI